MCGSCPSCGKPQYGECVCDACLEVATAGDLKALLARIEALEDKAKEQERRIEQLEDQISYCVMREW
jgi:transcription elongation GreA/GreB family factor